MCFLVPLITDLNIVLVCFFFLLHVPFGCMYMCLIYTHCETYTGVCHLAGKLIDRFETTQKELEITDREAHLIRVAGLCHDLGHGPFSHVFDSEFIPRVTGGTIDWHHEKASLMMFRDMIEKHNLDYEKNEIRLVESLITGEKPKNAPLNSERYEKKFFWQIVANKTNSVDVDKFDYLARDSYNLGLKTSYDFTRIMQYCKVIDGEICYYSKEAYNLYEMFHTRYSLHKQIYTHRVGKAVEYMITDALIEANPYLKISDSIHDPEEYMNMTDCILHQIESSKAPELAAAKAIIRRIRTRDLYKFVNEQQISTALKVTENDILAYQSSDQVQLRPEDVIIHDLKINYAMKDRDPVRHCKFYQSGILVPFYIESKNSVSMLIPECFEERYIRLYVRNKNHLEAAQTAFKNWSAQMEKINKKSNKDTSKHLPDVSYAEKSPRYPNMNLSRRELDFDC
jgi:HD superfamily phosphohydrolase